MLSINIKVNYLDGRSVDVKAGPVTQVAFEREHKVGIVAIATENKLSHVYWLAWHASRSGTEFDAWLESLESVEFDVSSPDPTKPAPPAD